MNKLFIITIIFTLFIFCDKSPVKPSESGTPDGCPVVEDPSSSSKITFANNYGGPDDEYAQSVIKTADGGYALFGYKTILTKGHDFYLVKTDLYGNLQWQFSYGDPSSEEMGHQVRETPDGGFIMIGDITYSDIDNVNSDIFIIKADKNGTIQWQKTLGENGIDGGRSIALSSDNGYVGTGFIKNNSGTDELLLFKLDANGTIQWQKTFIIGTGESIERTFDNGFIVTGTTGLTPSEPQNSQMYLLKVTSSGDLQWEKMFGCPFNDKSNSVKQTCNGGYIIAGHVNLDSLSSLQEAYLVRTDSWGNMLWIKGYFPSLFATANDITETSDGGFAFAGLLYNKSSLVKINSNGIFQWERSFTQDTLQTAMALISTSDGGFAIAGNAYINSQAKLNQAVLVKTDRDGKMRFTNY